MRLSIADDADSSVLSVKTVDTTVHSAVYPPNIPLDECDMLSEGMPHRLLIRHLRGGLDSATRALDRELLDGLDAAGFKISDTPLYELFLTVGGGFLLDVGAAQHIISGRVKVKHGVEVARLEPDSVVFTDGSSVAADVVIMAYACACALATGLTSSGTASDTRACAIRRRSCSAQMW